MDCKFNWATQRLSKIQLKGGGLKMDSIKEGGLNI